MRESVKLHCVQEWLDQQIQNDSQNLDEQSVMNVALTILAKRCWEQKILAHEAEAEKEEQPA